MRRTLLALCWLALSIGWISQDRLLRDGDEEGHVGAAELFRQQLAEGRVVDFAGDAWRGSLGEYPPLVPAITGAWWWATGVGQPGRVPVRGLNLAWLLLAAWATGRIAAHTVRGPPAHRDIEDAAFALVLTLPLANGLARHFMPEGALGAAVAMAVLAAVQAGRHRDTPHALLLGLALGVGLLVKQTFVLLAVLPVAVAAARQGRRWVWTVLVALAVAGPWYLGQLDAQIGYLGHSAAGNAAHGLWLQAAYYPSVAAWLALGPVLSLGLLWLLPAARRQPRAWWLGLAWLVGGALLLTLVPKKYPRLLAPLTPGAALLISAGLAGHRRRWAEPLVLSAGAWLALASLVDVPAPTWVRAMHPRCMQRWLRPPVDDDLGMSAVAEAVRRSAPGPVAVVGGPSIPCALQTTHDWSYHLGPYLRREGIEREVIEGSRGALVIDWTGGPGRQVDVSALGRAFWLRTP